MDKRYKILILILILIILSSIILIGLKYNSKILNNNQIQIFKKYFFPYKVINQQEKKLIKLEKRIAKKDRDLINFLINKDMLFKKSSADIISDQKKQINLDENLKMIKYQILSGFNLGLGSMFPGSGYLDFHLNKLFILSSRGVLGYTQDFSDKLIFKQIKNNLNDYIDIKQFSKEPKSSFRDLKIYKNKIFISLTKEIEENCWNTSVLFSDINLKKIEFKTLFLPEKCIHSIDNIDREFKVGQSGGRIVGFDENNILLTNGEYRNRYLAQEKNSVNGKIIKINFNNYNYQILSMGHRNPQGIDIDTVNKIILSTEHGPKGGDEINLIEYDKLENDLIPNFGWPIVSIGEHYDGASNKKKYFLKKSHKENGFIEPIKSFNEAIGISEITKLYGNLYVVSSMKDKAIYFFKLKKNKIFKLTRVEVFERVRDIIFHKKKLYLFLEDSASIGIIEIP